MGGANFQSGSIFGQNCGPSLAKLFEDPVERESRERVMGRLGEPNCSSLLVLSLVNIERIE